MGVLQRFERRLEGMIEGTFARVFGGVVQPVEVAAALQREAGEKRVLVAQGRILVPNEFVVELGESDGERLKAYDAPLRREFAAMVSEHAEEQGWSFVGPVNVHLESVPDLDTGVFRVRSAVVADPSGAQPSVPAPVARRPLAVRPPFAAEPPAAVAPLPIPVVRPPAPAPLTVTAAAPTRRPGPYVLMGGREVALHGPVTRIGRAAEADLRLTDTGVSRAHAEIRLEGGRAVLEDLGSTNGTTLNGHRVQNAELHDGDRIDVGSTTIVFRQDG